jgi:aspartyl aminopeptidase
MSDPARSLLGFIQAAPSPHHAVQHAASRLLGAGFSPLDEAESWQLRPGARHFVCRGGTSLAAFVVGQEPAQHSGFRLIGAHTDSPNLRLRPRPEQDQSGYRQLGVEVYGGVLWSTWLDRDLSIAGRVVLDAGGGSRLVDFGRPLLRIPNVAIHLNRTVNVEGLILNPQRHLTPILGLSSKTAPSVRELLAAELGRTGEAAKPERILSWDLSLYDCQPGVLSGPNQEFVQAARLDNLASCHAAIEALRDAPAEHPATRAAVLFDHEEVGSVSGQGADSSFLPQLLQRICLTTPDAAPDSFARACVRSFLISADMAHAVHPNYPEKHESQHMPLLGGGPVLKTNVNQSYATDAESAARFSELCRAAETPLQHFVSRADQACGSTIGPITAAQLGIRTVDVGSPLLSMHSIREMASAADVDAFLRVCRQFFA